jgi:hypothetical protein
MNPAKAHKKFIFNENIDEEHIHSLYEYDYAYIAEVFNSSIESLKEETGNFSSAYESSDIPALKRALHKIKPLFGFTGLLHHQEMIARFEHLCENASSMSNITMQYMELTEMIGEGRNILKEDCNRLTEFIS